MSKNMKEPSHLRTIKFTEELLAKMGSNSLLGILISLTKDQPLSSLEKVILQFPESSLDYCRNHNGPRWMMIPEYVIGCIIPNIIYLTKLGIEIEIQTYPHPED